MVLYTPLDHHDIFEEEEEEYQMSMYRGRMVSSRTDEMGKQRIVRLLSTDPADYLATEFSQGKLYQMRLSKTTDNMV